MKEEIKLNTQGLEPDFVEQLKKDVRHNKIKLLFQNKILPFAVSVLLVGGMAYSIAKVQKSKYLPVNTIKDIEIIGSELHLDEAWIREASVVCSSQKGIEMCVEPELLQEYEEDFLWCQDYLNDIFALINPNIKFFITSLQEQSQYQTISYYIEEGEWCILGTNTSESRDVRGGRTFWGEKREYLQIAKNTVRLNEQFKDTFDNDKFCLRETILHETLHALGLDHVEREDGGGVMGSSIGAKILALSPKEFALLITFYGDKDKLEYYNDFLDWYECEYEKACLSSDKSANVDIYEYLNLSIDKQR